MRWGALIAAVSLIVIGVTGLIVVNAFQADFPPRTEFRRVPQGRFPRGRFPEGRFPFDRFDPGQFRSEGEMIFFTGASTDGPIARSGGPTWFRMHGGGCAVCHGPDGRGGRVSMMFETLDAPDVRYSVLTRPRTDGEEEHEPYNEATLRRAIRDGTEPNGERLNENMPRWEMSDGEVNSVIDYLKELSEETTRQPNGRSL
ncbi:MAG: hypothetical protein C4521_04230 [Actinobacteria bacterium]|nr:MAG: hypothetical protein C4521_04230 [Actinomycetota bacterium]